ncbi:DUF4142 domain-containing protein [Methylobacillus arboreus]|uniref:DUF4142 domain-containing protein n=1 Tax=Methylobacillus arboreus TaxID=755170 RepID=UPI001E4A2291|nr:DUF4142 domain-containing protein [Methylobacillus arboreus]MCB5191496.1 DUF4142 domain-containing protein [Methylobacillus arboreus]
MSSQVEQWLRVQSPSLLALLLIALPMFVIDSMAAESLSARDQGYLKDIGRLNVLQIEASELAVVKSSNENVREFAREVVKEHMQLGEELKLLAQHKHAKLPKEPSLWQKAKFRNLSSKDGAEFDQSYAKSIGVKTQEETVKLLEKVASRADDPDLKAFALQHLPSPESSLETAKALLAVIQATEDE